MRKWLTLVFLFNVGIAAAQKIPDYGFNKIRIALSDRIVQADLEPLKKDPEILTDRLYYWSSSNAIRTTQGGFSGKLLNGAYTEYYLNKNLKEQGQFKAGLKQGIWKSWNENGSLIEYYSWDDGVLSGKFETFGSDGKLTQTGHYKNNLLHGAKTTYALDGKVEVVYYKNGKIVEGKPSKFWKRVNIFKRFKKASNNEKAVSKKQPIPKS